MKIDELNNLWVDIELQKGENDKFLQRMVYVSLLYRVYIGSSGIPAKRFLALEIPEKDINQFESFNVPQGIKLQIGEPMVKHTGYVACVLQAGSADQNDVFAIVTMDILDNLQREKKAEKYIATLKKRIDKWKEFFRNSSEKHLSDKMVVGLMGELYFIKDLKEKGIEIAPDLWNGPILSAQDFQGEKVAIEVKTTTANSLEYVHISSEIQLDIADYNSLFLVVYRIERNDELGMTLPELIEKVIGSLNDRQISCFMAKLMCLGYSEGDKEFYKKKYAWKECRTYRVIDGFPRILRTGIPKGVDDVTYRLSLDVCNEFAVEFDGIPQAIKEYEYG